MNLENVADVYPLTPMQEGMLFHAISETASGVYIDQVVFSLQGELNFERLQDCIQQIFARYHILRTAFVWDGVDQPLQVVREEVRFPVEKLSWLGMPHDEQQDQLKELVLDETRIGFNVELAPLIRVRAIETTSDTWKLLIVFHHLILDGWSVGLLSRELFAAYCGAAMSSGSICQFREYVGWHAQQDQQKANNYWRQELSGFDQKNHIGVTESLPVVASDPRFAQHGLVLSREESETLQAFARSQRVTLNTLMVAAWSLTVARYSGQNDVVFGRTVAGRPTSIENSQSAIGNFINTLPFRSVLQRQAQTTDWLQQIQSTQFRQTEFEFSSLIQVQKQSDIPTGESLFDSILVFENYPTDDLEFDDLSVTDVQHFEQSNYPLAFLIVPRKTGIELLLIYNVNVYAEWFVERVLDFVHFKLQELCSCTGKAMGDLMSTLPPDDHEQLNRIFTPSNESIGHKKTVIDRFREVVRSAPDSIAAVCDGRRISYGELDRKSNQIANLLHELAVTRQSAVGICVDRSIEMLVGILGVIKSGCFYVPLDRVYPREYFEHVIADAGISTILTRQEFVDRLPDNDKLNLLLFDDCQGSTEPVEVLPDRHDLAYAIYTSGSTGKPKGVMIDHGNLIESTLARLQYYLENPTAYLLLSSFAFDSSVAGIFWTLCTGGKLVMPSVDGEKDTFGLCQLIHDEKVTHLLCLPALYRLIIESEQSGQLDSLKAAIVAGDVVTNDVVETHFNCLCNRSVPWKLYNEYGPTENSVWATVHEIKAGEGKNVPIGKPICNTGIAILDDAAVPVPVGALGEIALTGSGLSRGYIGADALTERSFKTGFRIFGSRQRIYLTGDLGYLDANGAILFAGRKDRQVKVRGYRVELEEIEAVLSTLNDVGELAVVLQEIGPRRQMVCYYSGAKTTERLAWKSEIGERLADFMIPDAFVANDAMPKLPNGKINRKLLQTLEVSQVSTESTAPRNEIEETMLQIWQEVLGVQQPGVRDNFFSLGGDSILSIQVISRARRSGLVIKPGDIGLYPTIEELAIRITNESDAEISRRPAEVSSLAPMQEWFFSQKFTNPDHWNLSQLFQLSPDYDLAKLHQAIQFVLESHPAFQYRFVADHGQRKIEPDISKLEFQIHQFEEDSRQQLFDLQQKLDIENGPLFQLGLLKTNGGSDQLLFVVHHLIMDLVSWRILIDDIEHVYNQIEKNVRPDLPREPISFAQWIQWCGMEVEQVEDSEVEHWNSILSGSASSGATQRFVEQDCETVVASLGEDLTRELLGASNSVYNTHVQDLLLAGLGKTLTEWFNAERVVVELESHGRETDDKIDLSRTIGWFSATFPLILEFKSDDLAGSIKQIKECVRSVPRDGVLFNALRNSGIVHNCHADLLFNYHGNMHPGPSNGILFPVPGGLANARSAANQRTHAIEINAVVNNCLEVSWRFDCHKYERQLIEYLAGQFMTNLEEIVKHCRSGKTQFTPSDFVESGLSQSELDDFLEDFD